MGCTRIEPPDKGDGMEEQRLSFALLLSYLHRVLEVVKDSLQPSNAQRYRLLNGALRAFAVFYLQCLSFLEISARCRVAKGTTMPNGCSE